MPSIGVTKLRYWDDVIRGMVNVVHGEHGTGRRSGAGANIVLQEKREQLKFLE